MLKRLKDILEWSSSNLALESALNNEKDSEYSLLSKDLARGMSKGGFMQSLIAVSSLTSEWPDTIYLQLWPESLIKERKLEIEL